jgi:hypothetical protein
MEVHINIPLSVIPSCSRIEIVTTVFTPSQFGRVVSPRLPAKPNGSIPHCETEQYRMFPHKSPPCGDAVEIDQLLKELQESFFNNTILLCRLKDLLAGPDHDAAAMPQATAVVHDADAPMRTEEYKYEEDIAAILQAKLSTHLRGRPIPRQPLFQEDGPTVSQENAQLGPGLGGMNGYANSSGPPQAKTCFERTGPRSTRPKTCKNPQSEPSPLKKDGI